MFKGFVIDSMRAAALSLIAVSALFAPSLVCAQPSNIVPELTDDNVKVTFKVHAPWNILEGRAEQTHGKISLAADRAPESLRADLSAQEVAYEAGFSVAGRLVAAWLRANPPTPGRFVINSSALKCTPEKLTAQSHCEGTVDGELTLWKQAHRMDIKIEATPGEKGILFTGKKEIRWGEYGFGASDSTIAYLKPVIEMKFSIEAPVE